MLNRRVFRRTVMLILASGLGPVASVWAAGTTGADVLLANRGARPAALGGAYAAVGGDAQVLLFNPAALATVSGYSAVVQHDFTAEEIAYDFLGYSQPWDEVGQVAGAVLWRHLPAIDNPGAPDAPVEVHDLVAVFGVSRPLEELWPGLFGGLPGLSAGAAGKIIVGVLREATAGAIAVDAGLFWQAPADWPVGAAVSLAVQNAGTSMRYVSAGDPLPLCGRAAAAFMPLRASRHEALVTGEVLALPTEPPTASLGLEYTFARVLSFRLGYTAAGTEDLTGPAAGLGVTFSAGGVTGRLDYTYRFTWWNGWDSTDNNHFLALGVSF